MYTLGPNLRHASVGGYLLISLTLLSTAACGDNEQPEQAPREILDPPCPSQPGEYQVGFTQAREQLWWPHDRVDCLELAAYRPSAAALGPAIEHGISQWNQAAKGCDAGICLAYSGPVQESPGLGYRPEFSDKDQVNFVYFATDFDETDRLTFGGVVAVTLLAADVDTGEVLDADIEVNDIDYTFGEDKDLNDTLTHEVGHVIGFAHTRAEGAIMNPETYDGSTGLKINGVDKAGICDLYSCYPLPTNGR